nr:Protein C16D9.6 [Haemonchus contortus]
MDHPALLRRINSIALQVQNLGYRHQVTASRLVVVIVVFIVAIHLFFKISLPNSLYAFYYNFLFILMSDIISYERVKVSKQAQLLPKKGRLLCFVITTPKYHYTRVPAIYETWLPRCDHGQFFTSERMGEEVPHSTVLADLPDDYRYLFQKTMIALHYAYTNISDQFDWYYKADDDTYVIMEHMYEYLATLDPSEPYYLGYTMKPFLKRGYNGGGAGYVLSRAALKLFIDRAFHDRTNCPFDSSEDVGLGRCLQNIEIYPHDTRNENGQQRFHTYRPDDMFHGKVLDEWHYYPQINGHDWIAPDLISIHHLHQDEIRAYDDLLYRMRSPQLSHAVMPSQSDLYDDDEEDSQFNGRDALESGWSYPGCAAGDWSLSDASKEYGAYIDKPSLLRHCRPVLVTFLQ